MTTKPFLPIAFLFFLFWAVVLPAQSPYQDGRPVVDALNQRMQTFRQGQFTIKSSFKFADEADTISNEGVCYFFKRTPNPDSLAQFVVYEKGLPVFAYDGAQFFQVLHSAKKIWVKDVRALGGAPRVIRGSVQVDNLIYKNLLYDGRPAFRTHFFDSVAIEDLHEAGQRFVRLTHRDTTVEAALGNVENNKIISTLHFDFQWPDYRLARYTGLVWLFDGWQYEEKVFSDITSLPDSAQWHDYFNPATWGADYAMEQYDPNAKPKNEVPEIVADTPLPEVALADLDGRHFPVDYAADRLWLFDFWYKGCFPCQLAMPQLENLHQKFGGRGLRVLGVNPFDKDAGQLKTWLSSRKISYPTLLDAEKKMAKACGVSSYPFLMLVDARTKKVLLTHTGFSEQMEAELQVEIEKHLK